MPTKDPLESVENIVQLPSTRRPIAVPTLQVPRTQPAPIVLFQSWVATRDRAAATLLSGKRRVVLTGPAGTGKTVLLEHVARVLRAAGRTVMIQLADADPAPPEAGVTLFVDEADRLSSTKLRQLLDEAAGTVLLAGLAPLVQRVSGGTVKLTLDPLGQTDAQGYIAQWLALNGRTPAELDSKAVRALVELSGGVPRLLSTLLAAGSWLASSSDSRVIEASHIQEAAELRSVLGPASAVDNTATGRVPAPRRRVIWSALLTSVVLAGTAASIMPRLFPAETGRAVAHAPPFIQQAERWLHAEPSAPPRPVPAASVTAASVTAASKPAEPAQSVKLIEPELAAKPAEPVQASEPAAMPEPAKSVAELPPLAEPTPEPVQAAPEPPPAVPVPELKQPEVAAVQTTPPVVAPSSTLPVETIELLLRRGREMLAIEDFSAARLLFLRAVEGGSSEAMFELGQTYDPAFRTSIGGAAQSDRAEALRWYGRAAAVGNHAAERLLSKP